MKTLFTLACSIFFGFSSFGQSYNTDSIVNLLEGEWILTSLSGGFCGCEIDLGNTGDSANVRFEKHPISTDSVGYSFYSGGGAIVTGYSKIGYTVPIAMQPSGWFLENWPNNSGGGVGKRYFEVSDSSFSIGDQVGLTDGQTKHYIKKIKEQKYTLEGRVRVQNKVWDYGMIFLYDMVEGKAVDSVDFDNGIYLFTNVSGGTYTLYVVPYADISLTSVAKDYATTYYVNKLSLKEANTFDINANTYGVDFDLRATFATASVDVFSSVEMSAYPNPFTNELTIKTDQNGVGVRVLNIQGIMIYNEVLDQSTSINTSEWIKGVYFIEMRTQNGVTTHTMVK